MGENRNIRDGLLVHSLRLKAISHLLTNLVEPQTPPKDYESIRQGLGLLVEESAEAIFKIREALERKSKKRQG